MAPAYSNSQRIRGSYEMLFCAITSRISLSMHFDSTNIQFFFLSIFFMASETKQTAQLAIGVIIGCRFKLRKSFRMKLKPHFWYFDRKLAMAASPGIPDTTPARRSRNRRFASEVQRSWIYPSSAGSKLSTSRSARSARASLGSASASSAMSSTFICMKSPYQQAAQKQASIFLLPTSRSPAQPLWAAC